MLDGKICYVKGMFILLDGLPIIFFYNPDKVTESRSVKYAEINPLNVSHPVYHYVSGGETNISFTLLIKSNVKIGGPAYARIPVELVLESYKDLTYPKFLMNKMVAGPPRMKLILGTMVRDVIIKDINIQREVWDRLLLLRVSKIDITLAEILPKATSTMNRLNYIAGM